MNIALIGSGGREHALCQKIHESKISKNIICIPGNGGTAKIAKNINLDFSNVGKGKLFYDVIYNPKETNFLKTGRNLGNKTENGKKMFIFQAAESFKVWHHVQPEINDEVSKLLD